MAYIISWNVRFPNQGMHQTKRAELDEVGQQVCRLRYRATREIEGRSDYKVWSFAFIGDLRSRDEKEG